MRRNLFVILACLAAVGVGIAFAAKPSIHTMVVDGKALDVEVRQVTFAEDGSVLDAWLSPDGRTVAYATFPQYAHDPEAVRLAVRQIRPVGMPSVVLMLAGPAPDNMESWHWGSGGVAWSPDSRRFAFPATRTPPGESGQKNETYLLVFSRSGVKETQFRLPDNAWVSGDLFWRPNSAALALHVRPSVTAPGVPPRSLHEVVVFDLPGRWQRTVYFQASGSADLIGWNDRGNGLLIEKTEPKAKPVSLEVSVPDGNVRELGESRRMPDGVSPGGVFEAGRFGFLDKVRVRGTAKSFVIDRSGMFVKWSPNGRLMLYTKSLDTRDEPERALVQSLWLGAPVDSNVNHMPVALEYDQCSNWSADSRKFAFISRRRVFLAEITVRDPTTDEKIAAGIALTEDEEKQYVTANAKQIGLGLMQYVQDYDEQFPHDANVSSQLEPYLRNTDVFLRPGTSQNIFTYIPQDGGIADIENPADTPIGEMDAGYGWIVVLYADGHVKVRPK